LRPPSPDINAGEQLLADFDEDLQILTVWRPDQPQEFGGDTISHVVRRQ
jgi:hypothetical protein